MDAATTPQCGLKKQNDELAKRVKQLEDKVEKQAQALADAEVAAVSHGATRNMLIRAINELGVHFSTQVDEATARVSALLEESVRLQAKLAACEALAASVVRKEDSQLYT